jgi:hypothetical protein
MVFSGIADDPIDPFGARMNRIYQEKRTPVWIVCAAVHRGFERANLSSTVAAFKLKEDGRQKTEVRVLITGRAIGCRTLEGARSVGAVE